MSIETNKQSKGSKRKELLYWSKMSLVILGVVSAWVIALSTLYHVLPHVMSYIDRAPDHVVVFAAIAVVALFWLYQHLSLSFRLKEKLVEGQRRIMRELGGISYQLERIADQLEGLDDLDDLDDGPEVKS